MQYLMACLFIAGLLLVAYGAYLAWTPAGFITAGTTLVFVSVAWVRGSGG